MKILIHIGHPAHVHLFKNLIRLLMERGDKVIITAVEKEFSTYLLEKYGFSYHLVGKNEKGLANKFINLVRTNHETYKISKEFQPDIMLGVAGINISQVGKFLGVKSIVMDDTEHASLEIFLYRYFATKILTPSCFSKNMGSKQIRYNGYHELAYLHPKYFTPIPEVLDSLGLSKGEKFTVFRFVSWSATHDSGHKGITIDNKITAVKEFEKYGKVFISSEGKLPHNLEKYRINIPSEKIHDVLAYASLLYGESSTMASECSVLGTPSIFIDNDGRCYTKEQEESYNLVFNFSESLEDQKLSIEKGIELLKLENSKNTFKRRSLKILKDKIDTTEFMINFVNNYR